MSALSPRKRWRLAFATLYCMRAFATLYSRPYLAIDIADEEKGIGEIIMRRKAFGSRKTLHIVLETYKDPIMIVLLLSATFSFGFGIGKHGLEGCSDGVSIFGAVFLVIAVRSLSNYWPARQLYELSKSTKMAENDNVSWEKNRTPLQMKLKRLTSIVAMIGLVVASLVLAILLLRYFKGSFRGNVGKSIVGILVTPVAIASTAIPEGLLLALTIAIACTTKKIADENVVVRDLSACEVVSRATVICTKRRGIFKMSQPKVIQCWIDRTNINDAGVSSISPRILDLLHEAISSNDTYVSPEHPTEMTDREIQHAIEGWWNRKTKVNSAQMSNKTAKGAPEMVLKMCSHYCDRNGTIKAITDDEQAKLKQVVEDMRKSGFYCVAFAFKEDNWTLLAFIGLKPPCQLKDRKAVKDCQKAGVTVKMITEDDIVTARASAVECGIIKPGTDSDSDSVVKATDLWECSNEERQERVEKILVLARASTIDRLEMVKILEQKGHVVAVTGHSKADLRPSLKVQGTDNNVLIFDNFASLARVIRWGRGMYNNIQIFTQFQLTASIASLVIDFVTTISATELPTINIVAAISAGKVPYATFQILWVKLIMGTLAALALTADKDAEKLMLQPPIDPNKPFITNIMWISILCQSTYQITVLLAIQFTGESTFKLSSKRKDTLIFNIFVLCQLFSIVSARNYERSIFRGQHRNRLFWGIVGTIVLLQVMIVEMLKRFANTERLSWQQWKVCIGIAFLTWPIDWLIKCISLPRNPFLKKAEVLD